MDGEAHRHFLSSPLIIGLLGIAAGAIIVATYHCLVNNCCFIQSRISRAQPSEQSQVLPTTNHNRTRSISTHTSPAHLIPIFRYTKECREGTCAVCLCEFTDGEAIRVLPECMHLFHVGCIDMWLNSHTNCPLCRTDIMPRRQHVTVERIQTITYPNPNSVSHPPLQHVVLMPNLGGIPP